MDGIVCVSHPGGHRDTDLELAPAAFGGVDVYLQLHNPQGKVVDIGLLPWQSRRWLCFVAADFAKTSQVSGFPLLQG